MRLRRQKRDRIVVAFDDRQTIERQQTENDVATTQNGIAA